jgi:hypothetical protein
MICNGVFQYVFLWHGLLITVITIEWIHLIADSTLKEFFLYNFEIEVKGHVNFCHHLASFICRKLSRLNILLWNHWRVVPFQNCVRQPCPPFKMTVVTKNRNFINCLFLFYYKSKWAQIIFLFFLWNVSFSWFIRIMQIRHTLMKYHIWWERRPWPWP